MRYPPHHHQQKRTEDMNVTVTIKYSTSDAAFDGSGFETINDSVNAILSNTLPFMVDNVSIHFDVEEE